LIIQGTALLRLPAEQLEKARALAARPPGLRADALEFALLLVQRFFVAFDLVGPRRIAGAAIYRSKLRFQPRADGILRRGLLRSVLRPGRNACEHQQGRQNLPV
jgi:hypothetical protein